MELIQAQEHDLQDLLNFYRMVADHMEDSGIRHWHWGLYPTEEIIGEDVVRGRMYLMRAEGTLAAAVAVRYGQEKIHEQVPWTCGIRPGSFMRLAVNPAMQGSGIGGIVVDDVQQMLRHGGCDCVRCDTAETNDHALRLYDKLGFRRCGRIRWPELDCDNIAFDKPLKRETPMWPIRMTPAFRSGALTPWGGSRMKELFGKDSPDDRTGESLEVSCIPGLESRDPLGRSLPELIREFGSKLVGRCADQPFPLLLKLIDARDRLSVQVHPNDAYAASRENGKLGKTEAWLILDTPPEGGELVYGLRPGTTLKALRDACREGKAVESLLNRVRVRPGDVCFIPAGCVHAIGRDMLLYEIQQSSDITYRFYDWDRVDANGRRRELHLDRALDVTDLKCSPSPIRVERSFGVKRVLNEEYFTLDVLRTDSIVNLPPVRDFGLFTVIEGELTLHWAGAEMCLKAGETCFLPASVPPLAAEGCGAAALSMPNNA